MAKSEKLPALQFYPGDWKKDPGVQALDRFTRSVWFDILLLMHESDSRGVLLLNGVPYPEEALANILLLDKQNLTTALNKIISYGVASVRPSDGALINRRMVRDEELRQIRRIAGLQGGNPNLLNQKVNQNPTSQVNQNPTPSSSSSSSITSSISKRNKHTTCVANESLGPEKPKAVRATTENKTEFAPGVFLTEQEHAGFVTKFGRQFVDRCCEKLSAWIEQDPIPKRKRNGVNAAATFRAWVLNSVSEEEARAARLPAPKEKKLYGADLVRDMEERLARGETI